MVDNHAAAIAEQRDRVTAIEQYLDIAAKRERLEELRAEASAPDLWDDPDAGREVTQRLAQVERDVDRYEQLMAQLEDLETLNELAQEMDDEDSAKEVAAGVVSASPTSVTR